MPRHQLRFGQKIAFGGLFLLFLGLAGCEAGNVAAREISRSNDSGISMPRELRTALEEALPTGESGGQLPDADEAFLYGVGIGAIQELYIEEFHPREIAMAGLKKLGGSSNFTFRSSNGVTTVNGPGGKTEFEEPLGDYYLEWGLHSAFITLHMVTSSERIRRMPQTTRETAMFEGYMDLLDGVSLYLPAAEAEMFRDDVFGFGGMGILIAYEENGIRIREVIREGPAARAGLRNGDLITHVNGRRVTGEMSEDMVLSLLRGPVGSVATVMLQREGRTLRRAVSREIVALPSLRGQMVGDVAVIQMAVFSEQSTAEFMDVVREMRKEKPTSWLLDLRENPGGLKTVAQEIADLVIGSGPILVSAGRNGSDKDFVEAKPNDVLLGAPLLVLINGNSASASEILASAIQDNGRGIVVGSTSFGKGSIQTSFDLPNGALMTVTSGAFFAPSGAPLNKTGVTPNVCLTDRSQNVVIKDTFGNDPDIAAIRARSVISKNKNSKSAYRNICPPSERYTEDDSDVALRLAMDLDAYDRILSASSSLSSLQ
ncbi:MAG: S41 family peptidase [Alphaproteobacteria bacterium]